MSNWPRLFAEFVDRKTNPLKLRAIAETKTESQMPHLMHSCDPKIAARQLAKYVTRHISLFLRNGFQSDFLPSEVNNGNSKIRRVNISEIPDKLRELPDRSIQCHKCGNSGILESEFAMPPQLKPATPTSEQSASRIVRVKPIKNDISRACACTPSISSVIPRGFSPRLGDRSPEPLLARYSQRSALKATEFQLGDK